MSAKPQTCSFGQDRLFQYFGFPAFLNSFQSSLLAGPLVKVFCPVCPFHVPFLPMSDENYYRCSHLSHFARTTPVVVQHRGPQQMAGAEENQKVRAALEEGPSAD